MGSALWIAISGLNASSKQMDVIGKNIANANTMGFKAGKAYFANVLSQSLSGGASGVMQIGQGVTVADVATQFSQGSLESTSSSLDLAIDGGGFFIVEDDEGSQYYTRAGAFHIDGDGYLVDVNDYRVQGYAPSSPALGDINTRDAQSSPVASTSFSVGLNLDSRTDAGDTFYHRRAQEIVSHCEAVTVSVFRGDPDRDQQLTSLTAFLDLKGERLPRVLLKIVGGMTDGEFELYARLGLPVLSRRLHLPESNRRYTGGLPPLPEHGICLDLLAHPSVAWDGRVSVCNRLDATGRGVLGTLATHTLDDLWNGPLRKEILGHHLRGQRQAVPFCATCTYYGVPAA